MAKKPDSAKSALIESFITLVAELGAHQVTLQKTAKKAKVPFSTAHYYYGNDWDLIFKDAALKVGIDAQNFIATYLQNHSTLESNPIELYVVGTFEWILTRNKESRLWLFNYYFSSLKKEFLLFQEQVVELARKRVTNLLFEAKGRGFYPDLQITPERAAVVHTVLLGMTMMSIVQSLDAKKVQRLKEDTLKQVRCFLEA